MTRTLFPFAAIIAQAELKHALLLTVINPRIGGVLIRGERGTAKSTVVRALDELLPGPLRTLALSASEENVLGGLDLERTLADGSPVYKPGLLAEADGGIVYVDEINLLDEHLANLVLDASSSGVIRLEREGLSVQAASDFALVGTMNPEEGPLAAQLTDRFGLCVDVVGESQLTDRMEIIARRLAFDAAPRTFRESYAEEQKALSDRLSEARKRIDQVQLPDSVSEYAAELAGAAMVAGHRADLTIALAAQANAAWAGRSLTTIADVDAVAEMALRHRRRGLDAANPQQPSASPPPSELSDEAAHAEQPAHDAAADQLAQVGEPFAVRTLSQVVDRVPRSGRGRRSQSLAADARGHVIGWRPTSEPLDLAVAATLRAAAPHQIRRRALAQQRRDSRADLAILIEPSDWQRRKRTRKTSSVVVLVVDASGSMGARNRMVASKGAVLSLLLDAYVKRDQVALVSFRGEDAQVLVPATSSIELARDRLRELPTGGRTPLSAGLLIAVQTVQPILLKDPHARPLIVVVTDGRGNVNLAGEVSRGATDEAIALAARLSADSRISWVVVDTEPGVTARGRSMDLARALGAHHFSIDQLRADQLVNVVNSVRDEQES